MQMVDKRGLHINGEEIPVCRWYPVVHKWSNRLLAQVGEASQDDVEAAVRSAREALSKPTSVHDRSPEGEAPLILDEPVGIAT